MRRELEVARFRGMLIRYRACEGARLWCAGKTLGEAWAECENPYWMYWFLRMASKSFDPGMLTFEEWKFPCGRLSDEICRLHREFGFGFVGMKKVAELIRCYFRVAHYDSKRGVVLD